MSTFSVLRDCWVSSYARAAPRGAGASQPPWQCPVSSAVSSEAQQVIQECVSAKIPFCKEKVYFHKGRFVRPAEVASVLELVFENFLSVLLLAI